MAVAGYARNIFPYFNYLSQFTASSIQHVSGRLRSQALLQMLAGGLPSLSKKKNAIEPNPWTKNEYPRVSVPIC